MSSPQSLEIELQRLVERYEDQPGSRVFAPLADCHRKLGDLDEALRICQSGLARHPRYSSAFVILGKIHLERGDDDAASEAFEEVLELDPQNLLAIRHLAQIAEEEGAIDRALQLWRDVASIDPDGEAVEATIDRLEAVIDEEGDDRADAEALVDYADDEQEEPSTHSTSSEIATITLAEIYAEQGFKSKALEIFRQVRDRRPDLVAVADRVRALEAEVRAIEESSAAAQREEVATPRVTVPPTQVLSAGVAEDGPGAKPIAAGTSDGSSSPEEDERYARFSTWLDRVRSDED